MVIFNQPTELDIFDQAPSIIQKQADTIIVDGKRVVGNATVYCYSNSWYFGYALIRVPAIEYSFNVLVMAFSKLGIHVNDSWLDAITFRIIAVLENDSWELRLDFHCTPPSIPWLS